MNRLSTSIRNNPSALGLFLALWILASLFMPEYVIPAPWKVFTGLDSPAVYELLRHLAITFGRVIISLLLALIIGTGIGLLGYHNKKASILDAFLVLLQTVPAIILGLIFLFIFGQSWIVPVSLSTLLMLPLMSISVTTALRKRRPGFEDLVRSFGGGRRLITRDVLIPSLVPVFLSNLITGSGFGLKVVLIAEFITGKDGIGFLLNSARLNMRMDTVFLCLIVLLLSMLIFHLSVSAIFNAKWRKYFNPEV